MNKKHISTTKHFSYNYWNYLISLINDVLMLPKIKHKSDFLETLIFQLHAMIYCVPKLSKLSFGFLIELKVCYCWESKFSIHNFELHTRIISDIIWVCLLLNYQKIPILTSLDLPLTFLRFYEKGFSMVGPNFYILRLFLSGYLHNNMIQYQTDM